MALISLFVSNLVFFWLTMFLILVTFIKNEESVKDSMIKFIFIQELLSGLMVLSFVSSLYSESVMFLLLLMKMGVPPFHSWVLLLLKSVSWLECIMFLTLLKIVPMFMIFNLKLGLNLVLALSMVSTVLLFSSVGVKEMLFFSSSSNSMLMILVSYFSYSKAIYYFLFYSLLLLWALWDNESKSPMDISTCLLLVFMGVPPLIIFMVKYLLFAIYSNSVVFFLPFLIFLVLNLYCYFFLITKNWLLLKSTPDKSMKMHKFWFIFSSLLFVVFFL